jgi:hypothetical protein
MMRVFQPAQHPAIGLNPLYKHPVIHVVYHAQLKKECQEISAISPSLTDIGYE